MTKQEKEMLDLIDARTGTFSTDEQLEFASNFTQPTYSFSNPGTGKSHSIVKALIMLQTYHRVPGRKINAMSFTREATAELKARYDKACKKCDIVPTVTFNTFHSICNTIVKYKYPSMKIKKGWDWESDLEMLQEYMHKRGVDADACDNMYYVKQVIKSIDTLNHSLIYDDTAVSLTYAFKKLEMPLEIFQGLRTDMFTYGLIMKCIPQGDIPNYALRVLAEDTKLQNQYKEMYQVMVVDEFQDMTKLYLTILALISKNLVVIGDMKQQIYGFNGACPQIIREYLKIYPDARQVNLTQSFRCKNEIADYATTIYWPNDVTTQAFKGTGDGGTIQVVSDKQLDLKSIVEKIKVEQDKEDRASARTSMFLFRNNFSITPIAEELYQQNVLFRVKRFYKVMDYPIFCELSKLGLAAMEPTRRQYQVDAISLFPEFRGYNEYTNPFLQACQGKSIFDIEYKFREASSHDFMLAMQRAKALIDANATADKVFNVLWKIYEEYIIERKWWKLEHNKQFYIDLVTPIVTKKTFQTMIAEEWDKSIKTQDAMNAGMGVKCFTMHSAKGLEAHDVYILDVDAGIFPSAKHFKELLDLGCEYEAAKMVREERNLLYVAITRAKENVYITYYDELTSLVSSPKHNKYSELDAVYEATNDDYDDVGAFLRSINLKDKVDESLYKDRKPEADFVHVADDAPDLIDFDDVPMGSQKGA